jgi:hypothetical protein
MHAAIVLGLVSGALIGLMHFPDPARHVSCMNARRIQPGMTLQEVEAILKVPSGDYRTRVPFTGLTTFVTPGSKLDEFEHHWNTNHANVQVVFDKEYRVLRVQAKVQEHPVVLEIRYRLGML